MKLPLLLIISLSLLSSCYIEGHSYDSHAHAHAHAQPSSTEYFQTRNVAAIGDYDYIAPVSYDQLGCQSNFGPKELLPYVDLQESTQFAEFSYDAPYIAGDGLAQFDAQLTDINNRLAQVEDLAFQLCDPSLDSVDSCAFNQFSQGQFDYTVANAYATDQIFAYDIMLFDRLSGRQQLFASISFFDAYKANGQYIEYTPYGVDTLTWSKDGYGDSQVIFSSAQQYTDLEERADCSGQVSTELSVSNISEQLQGHWDYLGQQLQLDIASGSQCLSLSNGQCQYEYY